MGPQQGVSHTAGRDDEGLDNKGSKDKCQDEGDEQRINGIFECLEGGVAGR